MQLPFNQMEVSVEVETVYEKWLMLRQIPPCWTSPRIIKISNTLLGWISQQLDSLWWCYLSLIKCNPCKQCFNFHSRLLSQMQVKLLRMRLKERSISATKRPQRIKRRRMRTLTRPLSSSTHRVTIMMPRGPGRLPAFTGTSTSNS